MTPPTHVECPQCGYEIASYPEALEALEAGCRCLLCSSELDADELEAAVDAWSEEEILAEGELRALDEEDVAREDSLFEGVPDFGDEGEDEEDPLI